MDSRILPEQLRAVMRLSLHFTVTESDPFDGPINEDNPVIRKLIQKIQFSRRFILTYYIVLAVGVLLWSCQRWIVKRKSRNVNLKTSKLSTSVSSSSSSTLCGTESPLKRNIADENVPLLGKHVVHTCSNRSTFDRVWCHLKAVLVAQPPPLPAATSHMNVMLSNGTTIATIIFLAINAFYLLYKTPFSIPMLFAFADRAALVFVVNLPILYTLAAKNNQPLKWMTGWSYEGLNLFHRRLGEFMTIVAVLHGIGMLGVWWTLLQPFGFSLGWYLSRRVILIGIFALVSYLLIYATSIGYVRQALYETFLALHVVLQIAALTLLFFHHHNARPYVAVTFAIWAIDRIVGRISTSTRSFIADLEVAADGETVLLFCRIPVSKSDLLTIRGGWRSGQHVFVSVPGIGWKHRLQSHPFTIASPAPPKDMKEGSWPLQLIIRAKDGFSRDLLNYTRFHQHTRVLLDGPYGSTDVLEAMHESSRVCLVAGGSGIAVTYPLAWNLQITSNDCDTLINTRTVYFNGKKHTPQLKLLESLPDAERFSHFWIRQKSNHDRWITFYPKKQLRLIPDGRFSGRSDEHQSTDLVTERFSTRDSANISSARPDIGLALREWIHGTSNARIDRNKLILIVVSGPDTLVREIRNTCASLIREGWRIEVMIEKFGW